MLIHEYAIALQVYHDEIIGRLQFSKNGTIEESGLYSLPELQNIIALWQDDSLLGSFAIGTTLAKTATFTLKGN